MKKNTLGEYNKSGTVDPTSQPSTRQVNKDTLTVAEKDCTLGVLTESSPDRSGQDFKTDTLNSANAGSATPGASTMQVCKAEIEEEHDFENSAEQFK